MPSLSRPLSQASSSRSSSKPSFQRKMKPRNRGLSNFEDLHFNFSTELKNTHSASSNTKDNYQSSKLSPNKNNNPQPQPQQQQQHDSQDFQQSSPTPNSYPSPHPSSQSYTDLQLKFNKTMSQLTESNLKHHQNLQEQLSSSCTCGRHLCKFTSTPIKPQLTKNTIYKKDFLKKNSQQRIPKTKPLIQPDHDKLQGPHLDMNSTQRSSFTNKISQAVQKPRPEDLLKNHGPVQGLTTYKMTHPGFKGLNQYVKPTDRHVRENFPLRSKSTYAQSFACREHKKDDYKYINDQLKTGGAWMGKSSYGNFFENPNPEYHAKKVKNVEKHQTNPKFTHQFKTIYKDDFINKETPVCGAKILLETKRKGSLSGSKGFFGENSDFKAMSPEYHAISTSKHVCV